MVAGGPYGLEEIVGRAGFTGAICDLARDPAPLERAHRLAGQRALERSAGIGRVLRLGQTGDGTLLGLSGGVAVAGRQYLRHGDLSDAFHSLPRAPRPRAWARDSPHVVGGLVLAVCTVVKSGAPGPWVSSSLFFSLALLSPFAFVIVGALCHPRRRPPQDAKTGDLDLVGGILVAMWNYMGWDNSSTLAGEVERPERTYPLAMMAVMGLVALTYVLAHPGRQPCRDRPIRVDDRLVGRRGRRGRGTVAENRHDRRRDAQALGMLNALILSYTRIPAVLAEDGYLPAILARRSRTTGALRFRSSCAPSRWGLALNLGFQRLFRSTCSCTA